VARPLPSHFGARTRPGRCDPRNAGPGRLSRFLPNWPGASRVGPVSFGLLDANLQRGVVLKNASFSGTGLFPDLVAWFESSSGLFGILNRNEVVSLIYLAEHNLTVSFMLELVLLFAAGFSVGYFVRALRSRRRRYRRFHLPPQVRLEPFKKNE
jgi:hypothetical protein